MKLFLCLGLAGFIAVLAWMMCLRGAAPTKGADLAKMWDRQIYGLDDDEVVRFVPPPFPAGRAQSYVVPAAVGGYGQVIFEMRPNGTRAPAGGSRKGTVASAIRWCSRRSYKDINGADADIPGAVASLLVDGDWVVRSGESVEKRLGSLQSILSGVTKHDFVIEKRMVEKNAIVARGKWELHPLAGPPDWAKTGVHLYADALDHANTFAEAGAVFDDLLFSLGRLIGQPVIDETDGPKAQALLWHTHPSARKAVTDAAKKAALLSNFQKQTSIDFHEEKRPVPVWFVRERGATTQSGGGK